MMSSSSRDLSGLPASFGTALDAIDSVEELAKHWSFERGDVGRKVERGSLIYLDLMQCFPGVR